MAILERIPRHYLFLIAACVAIPVYFGIDLYAESNSSLVTQTESNSQGDETSQLRSEPPERSPYGPIVALQNLSVQPTDTPVTPEDDGNWEHEREVALRYAIESHRRAQGIKVLSLDCKDGECTLKYIDYTDGDDWDFIARDLQKHPLYGEVRSSSGEGGRLPDGTMEYTTRWSKYPGSSEIDMEYLAKLRESRPRTATMEEAFSFFKNEAIDGVWSLETSAKLQSFITEHQYGNYVGPVSIECRSVSCALTFDAKTEDESFYWNLVERDLLEQFNSTFPSLLGGPVKNEGWFTGSNNVKIISSSGFRNRASESLRPLDTQ